MVSARLTLCNLKVKPDGGKVSRAAAASPQLEAGNWYVPHPMLEQWVSGFLGECGSFPAGANDDQVDAWSQGANRLLTHVERKPPRSWPGGGGNYGDAGWMAT
jgi:phage terminase large subunit-like protein